MMIAPSIVGLLEEHSSDLSETPLYIYPYSIDPDVQASKVNGIVVLVTEINDNPERAGSDITITKEASAQIQLFYPGDYEHDTSKVRNRIEFLLEDNGWYLTLDNGIERDPDTSNLFNTSHYRKEYVRERE